MALKALLLRAQDVLLKPCTKLGIVIELKATTDNNALEKNAQKALAQIHDLRYDVIYNKKV